MGAKDVPKNETVLFVCKHIICDPFSMTDINYVEWKKLTRNRNLLRLGQTDGDKGRNLKTEESVI